MKRGAPYVAIPLFWLVFNGYLVWREVAVRHHPGMAVVVVAAAILGVGGGIAAIRWFRARS